jgi:hypothetical protein
MRTFLATLICCLPLCAGNAAQARSWHRIAPHPVAAPELPYLGVGDQVMSVIAIPMRVGVAIVSGVVSGSGPADGVHEAVTAAALAAGVPISIAHAVVRMESGYNPRARSSSGAVGVMQVLPHTAAAMGENPYTFDGNLRAGMKYLALALRSSSDLCAAISGYNHGIAGRPYCTAYGRRVLAMAR